MKAGVRSASIHVRAYAINAAFSLGRRGLVAHPLLYGMITFARMIGPGAHLMAVQGQVPSVAHLKVWAVRSQRHILRVLVIDKARKSASIQLRLPGAGAATVQRLLPPSVRATSGVTRGGQQP